MHPRNRIEEIPRSKSQYSRCGGESECSCRQTAHTADQAARTLELLCEASDDLQSLKFLLDTLQRCTCTVQDRDRDLNNMSLTAIIQISCTGGGSATLGRLLATGMVVMLLVVLVVVMARVIWWRRTDVLFVLSRGVATPASHGQSAHHPCTMP